MSEKGELNIDQFERALRIMTVLRTLNRQGNQDLLEGITKATAGIGGLVISYLDRKENTELLKLLMAAKNEGQETVIANLLTMDKTKEVPPK
jgi:hypothetical protein